ncbi:uncharacterized protein LOC129921467 [Episyrphus balteatus]|uniref:uncharacterized protein LOC129921467 n=1 Tax=Episyrphus balteatus TaxID=286459 RepID=UPI0024856F61|nr:uncharacterized protein LOC129921467 [Episyrphus balteatus]
MECFSFTTSCRICLQIKPTNKSLFQYRNDSREPTNVKLSLITGIHVPEEEEHDIPEYPKFLCKECERLLDMAFDLRIKAQKSDEILNNFYKEIESNSQPDKRKRVINCKIQSSSKSIPSTPILNSSFTIETSKRSLLNTNQNHTLKTNPETPAINETEYTLKTYRSPSKEKDTEDPLSTQRIDFEDSNDSIYEVLSVEGSEGNCDIKDEIVEEGFVKNTIQIENVKSPQTKKIYSNPVMEAFSIEKVPPENKIDLLKIKTEWEEETDDSEKIDSKIEEIRACNKNKNDNSQVHLKREYSQEISKTEFNLNGIKKENCDNMDYVSTSEANENIDFKDNFIIKKEPDFEVEQNGEFKLTQSSDVDVKRVKLEDMIDMNDMEIDFGTGLLFVKAKSNAPSDVNLNT